MWERVKRLFARFFFFWTTPATPAPVLVSTGSPTQAGSRVAVLSQQGRRRPRNGTRVFGADQVALVGFHERGFVLCRPADPFSPKLLHAARHLHTRVAGRTNLADGLRVALVVLAESDPRRWQRIWLLSDGYPNLETAVTSSVVRDAVRRGIGIHTIGFGDRFDKGLLRRISQLAHGRFVSVQTLQQLTAALVRSGASAGRNRRPHQAETTVLCLDLSASMREPMQDSTKVGVVEAAVLQLLHYKQQCWS